MLSFKFFCQSDRKKQFSAIERLAGQKYERYIFEDILAES